MESASLDEHFVLVAHGDDPDGQLDCFFGSRELS